MRKNVLVVVFEIIFFIFFTVYNGVSFGQDNRPYLQVLPNGNLVIASAADRNLTLQTPGSGVVTVNGLDLAAYLGNSSKDCSTLTCSNGGTCLASKGGPVCICPPNWKGTNCQADVNECRMSTFATCLNGGTCLNLPGNFSCQCSPEYSGKYCETRFDDCTTTPCGNGTCVDIARTIQSLPAYQCICNAGWRKSTPHGPCSVDVNECADGSHTCSRQPRVTCINLPGSYSCGPCPTGYTTMGRDCVDINECAIQQPCSRNPLVSCTNVPGSYICGSCPHDFEGDGRQCQPVNRCQTSSSFCHPLATCVAVQNYALPHCNCPPGYDGVGYGPSGCFPVAGSGTGSLCSNGTCLNGGTCHSPPGAAYFTCICPLGFSGRRCETNINDCSYANCANGGICQDVVNGFRCICPPKFTGRLCETEMEGCGGFLLNASGTLEYPRFQTSYNNSMDCEWHIRVPSADKILLVDILRLNLENNYGCNFDFVEVRDGPTSAFPLLFPRLCGRTVPAAKNSTREAITVRFHSDASEAARGFKLRWTTITPKCGGVLTAPFGTISSPGFPGPYPARRSCAWRLRLVPDSIIQFTFTSFDVQSSTNCTASYVRVYAGWPPFQHTLLGNFCGEMAAMVPVRSLNSLATVIFRSSSVAGSNTGFSLHYSSTRPCGQDYSSPSGVIAFPPGGLTTQSYSPNIRCYWSVVLPASSQVRYEFERLNIGYSPGCSADYVELRNGFDHYVSQQLGIYCGRPTSVSTITGKTSSNTLLVKFHSDNDTSTSGTGFRLRYSTACGGTFTGHKGRIASPNFPNAYPNSSDCSYLITTGRSQRLALRFYGIDVQGPNDCVDIYDGSSANSPQLKHICRRYGAFEINSTTPSLFVTFKSQTGGRRGFRGYYESIGFDCGGILTDTQGVINTPEFPGRYPHGTSCYWGLSAPEGYVVRLSFSSFGLETHPNCQYDFVYVYENPSPGHNGTLGRYCGNQIPPVLTSFSNILHVKFSTDASVNDIGFSASYVFLDAHSACGGEIRHNFGLIRSPGFPNRYRNRQSCQWTIIGRAGSQVKLNITDFDLEQPSRAGACYDYLEIRQGGYASSPVVAKLCGNFLRQRVFIGFTNRMYLRFITDASVARPGFRIKFDTATTGCGGTLASPSGSVFSPNFPMPYNHLADCYWTIRVAKSTRLKITLPVVDLENHGRCRYDFIDLRDGSSTGRSLGRFCNSTSVPSQLTTETNQLWLRFRSDRSVAGGGFVLNYRTVCQSIDLNALHATIESPGYPDQYPANSNCSWTITAPTGNHINITFAEFDIAPSANCLNDYLAFYDIDGQESLKLLAKLCGRDKPMSITSRTNKLRVIFVSNSDRRSGEGFSLDYLIFGCGEIFTHPHGIISYATPSPSEDGIDPNVECRWSIRAPVGRRIILTITEMSIGELTEGSCETASLQIFNSPSMEGNPAATICGSLAPNRNFTSTGNFMTLHLNPIETFPNERSRLQALYRFIDGGCGGSFSVPSGVISSPLLPGTNNYPPHVFCEWFLHAQPMHAVNLTFLKFDLENSRQCRFDHVDVYDGFDTSDNGTRLLRHCGSSSPSPKTLISSHNNMLVQMLADGSLQASGFSASFREYCGTYVNLTETRPSVDFGSPNNPRPYPLGANCTWIFKTVGGGRIMLEFTRFDLPNVTSGDCETYVRVTDGEQADSIWLSNRTICGTALPPSIFTSSSILVVQFVSSISLIPRTGFLASATKLDQSTGCGRTVEADHGVITSPLYPQSYPPNFECIWTLKASPGNKIGIQFSNFELQSSESCTHDFVELRVGDASGRLLAPRACGQSVLPNGIQLANPVWIKFSSDATLQYQGFLLRFYTVYGGDYNGDSGQISSPHFPRPYGPNMNVRWTISVRPNYIIYLHFMAFDLEHSYNQSGACLGDFLEIRDGLSVNSPMLNDRMCGRRATPRAVFSTSNRMHIYFHTDASIEAMGFLAKWIAIPWRPQLPGSASWRCAFTVNISSSVPIVVSSPPNATNRSSCTWKINASPTNHIRINVTRLRIPDFSRRCRRGYLVFYEKIHDRTIETNRLCGMRNPTTALATLTSEVTIIYRPVRTNHPFYRSRFIGFSLSITEECGSLATISNGKITSPGFPQQYPPRSACSWTILGKPGRTISAKFDSQFGINDTPPCNTNYVQISTPNRARYCGTSAPSETFTSQSNYLSVSFITSATGAVSPGFSLAFKELPYPCGDRFWLSHENPEVIITSPQYPNRYLPHLDCRWLITAPAGKSIRINFDTVDIERGYSRGRCFHDVLEVRDGSTTHAPLLATLCNNKTVSTLRTTDNTLFIRFITDKSVQLTGFSVKLDLAVCGGTLYGMSGSLMSPRFPERYPASADCLWTINAPTGHFVSIIFNDFRLAGSGRRYGCSTRNDYVKIYDGPTTNDLVLRLMCGNMRYRLPRVNTSDSSAVVQFKANNDAETDVGFSARFVASVEECGGTINASSGIIQSPNWPGFYPHRRTCHWKIRVPEGRRVRLRFLNFTLEAPHQRLSCVWDFVAAFNGFGPSAPLIGRWCGTQPPSAVRSSMNSMSVTFRTDGSVSSGGFRAVFDSTEEQECGGTIQLIPNSPNVASNRGVITSPNYGITNATYGHSARCVWKFIVPAGVSGTMLLSFVDLRLEHQSNCAFDAVEIHEGVDFDSDTLSLGVFCTNRSSLPINVPTAVGPKAVWIVFNTDGSVAGAGFNLTYQLFACGGHLSLEPNAWITLRNPSYPSEDRAKQVCSWFGEGSADSKVQFRVDGVSLSCSMGNVTIFNGPSLRSPAVVNLCGAQSSTVNSVVRLETSRVRVVYQLLPQPTVTNLAGKFRVSLRARVGECGGIIHSMAGNLSSTNYPQRYSSGTVCTWVLSVPTGYHYHFSFSSPFDIPLSSGSCSENFVRAFEFPSSSTSDQLIIAGLQNSAVLANQKSILAPSCGTTAPPPDFNSIENIVAVTFSGTTPAAGFQLRWVVACGVTFTEDIGLISSPNYPNNYGNSLRCNYLIEPLSSVGVQQGSGFITFEFVAFDVEPGTSCQHDSLTIRGGNLTVRGRTFARLCGSTLPPQLTITSTSAVIAFKTDSSINSTGFQIRYRVIQCGGTLSLPDGSFGTPSSPTAYPHLANCSWTLRAPPGKIISLTFIEFDIETHPMCRFDFVEVFDGPDATSRSLGKFCGNRLPPILHSSGQVLFVIFQSDHSVAGTGFRASYLHVYPCGGVVHVPATGDSTGTLTSLDANGDGLYEPNLHCIWLLRLQPPTISRIIKITFTAFELQGGSDCRSGDFVQVIDNTFTNSSNFPAYCGTALAQKTLRSSDSSMSILFHSDGISNFRGFTVRYSATRPLCGGRLNATTSPLQLSWTPTNPPPSLTLHCLWLILAPTANDRISVTLAQVNIPDSPQCRQSFLELKDRAPRQGFIEQPAHYCGSAISYPVKFESTTDIVSVYYVGGQPAGNVFQLTYQKVSCNRTYTKSSGRFVSANFPAKYPPNVDCRTIIQAPSRTYLALYFNYLDIEFHTSCQYDYIAIHNGSTVSTPTLARFCGNASLPNPIFINSNIAMIRFRTDQSIPGGGYDITYTATPTIPGCGGNFTHINGTFTSPKYPFVYPSNVDCTWKIQLAARYQIVLAFRVFSLLPNATCATDNLSIYVGDSPAPSSLRTTLCETDNVAPLRIRSNSVTVVFRSGSLASSANRTTLAGFHLVFAGILV